MRRGHTLLEVIMASSLLVMVVASIFAIFDLGQGSYRLSVMRNDLQNQGRATLALLEREVEQTSLSGMAVADGSSRDLSLPEGTVARHAICLVGLDDWTNPANFDPISGLPNWNRYLIFYATTESPGRLIRLEVSRAGAINGPWVDFESYLGNDPAALSLPVDFTLEGHRVLAGDIYDFHLAPEDETMIFELKFRRRELAGLGGDRRRDETLQLKMEATPRNG